MDFMNEKFDIIIQAGQSNAQGYGMGEVDKEYVLNDDVLYLTNEKKVEVVNDELKIEFADKPFEIVVASEDIENDKPIGNFSLTFAEEYIKNGLLKKGRKLLIVRSAVGGTGFYRKHWGMDDILYKKMIEMTDYAVSLNPENKVVALLWHQGEHDAFEGNKPATYKAQLTSLVSAVRERYGKEIPFVSGDFCNEWKSKNLDSCNPIIDVIKEIVGMDENARFVETSDLPSNNQDTANGDDIHFCRKSQMILGRRYFDAFAQIIKK